MSRLPRRRTELQVLELLGKGAQPHRRQELLRLVGAAAVVLRCHRLRA